MGYRIAVNHQKISDAAKKAKDFVALNKGKIRGINRKLIFLGTSWAGTDAQAFTERWQELSSEFSVTNRLNTAMINYARCLEVAANRYKRAQADAINRANRLR